MHFTQILHEVGQKNADRNFATICHEVTQETRIGTKYDKKEKLMLLFFVAQLFMRCIIDL